MILLESITTIKFDSQSIPISFPFRSQNSQTITVIPKRVPKFETRFFYAYLCTAFRTGEPPDTLIPKLPFPRWAVHYEKTKNHHRGV